MQTFNIEVEGMQVTKELVRGLLRQYFNDIKYGGNIVVEEVNQQRAAKAGWQCPPPCNRWHGLDIKVCVVCNSPRL